MRRFVLALLAALGAMPAPAQVYPQKPIHVIVPTNPGGATDVVARVLAPTVSAELGQPIVIDNRIGAGGVIGTEAVAKAAPDGYTLLAVFDSFTANPYLYKSVRHDPLKDFTPICLVAKSAQVVVVPPRLGVQRFDDLIRLAKAKGSALNYATAGPGTSSRLTMELLKLTAGIDPTAVHYKGGSPAVTALLSGEVDMMIVTIGAVLPHLRSGKLTPLATTSATRNATLPELPTVNEFYPGFEAQSWTGVVGPAGLPQAIVARLNDVIVKALERGDVRERLTSQGYEIVGGTPAGFAAWVQTESARWERVIREQRIALE